MGFTNLRANGDWLQKLRDPWGILIAVAVIGVIIGIALIHEAAPTRPPPWDNVWDHRVGN
jgi:hypothetical protein